MPLPRKVTGPVSPKDMLHDRRFSKMHRKYGTKKRATFQADKSHFNKNRQLYLHFLKQGHSPQRARALTESAAMRRKC